MQKQKESLFHEKFRLLNSQEHNEDIKWSSSSSSDYENTSYNEKRNILGNSRNRKRKRKKKVPKNVSNLDITIVDSCKNNKSDMAIEKSPILISKRKVNPPSPILTSTYFPPNYNNSATSPILSAKRLCPKSPVLHLKSPSLNASRVRKQLYGEKNVSANENFTKVHDNLQFSSDKDDQRENKVRKSDILVTSCSKSESNSITSSESDSSLKAKLIEKVKNFFDSNFSSENTSQNISDTQTPTDCSKNEDIEILTCKTQSVSHINQSIKQESASNSNTSNFLDKSAKKLKYKKGGLAYRLNVLLKKQNAHVSLWQHERFLAGNSNFVIPKEENLMFHIQNVDFKYGCYLLSAIDMYNKKYLILINNKYVSINISVDSVFKLYEPYRTTAVNQECQIITNVIKFECVIIKE